MEMLTVKVKRYVPEKGSSDLESFQVPYEKDMSLLMVLEHLYEEKESTFAIPAMWDCAPSALLR